MDSIPIIDYGEESPNTIIENSFSDTYSYNDYGVQTPLLEAAKVFILMPKNVPVSRSSRFQWLLDHLNCVVTVPSEHKLSNTSNDLEIISVVPTVEPSVPMSRFLVTSTTQVIFLAQTYRFVYCLDMSPSQSAVDIHQGEILFDEIINYFRTSLLGLCRQFTIPGNTLVFQPCLYLTVIVNTPFFISPAQQVIIKGVQVSSHNVQDIINLVQAQFHHLEGRIADVSAMAYDQMDKQMMDSEVMVGGLFDLIENDCIANIPMVSPDANFVNMLRYSMLAISLLPENSMSHILVITDGVVAMPDSNIMESLLYQLHYDSIVVSFLKVGSTFRPHSSAGYVPYTDLLHFLSHSTLGTVLDVFPVVKPEPTFSMNLYQELYLLWTFHTKTKVISPQLLIEHDNTITNGSTPTNRAPTLLTKRQSEEKVNSSLLLLVSRRMREGYTVNTVNYNSGKLEIKLSLHWKTYIYIHYVLMSSWPITKNSTHIEIYVSAPYDFLHDITCIMKKETKSTYRQAVFERFWIRSTQLASNDTVLAQQLSSFQNSIWYTLPDSVRSGLPVFIINTNLPYEPFKLLMTPRDTSCPKFTQMWQPICHIDTNNWRKWFHTHKLSLILKHDHPLPKHMHLSNSSGRFQIIQCRQAATALYELLNDWASFVLVDNHTYLKLLYREHDKPPVWFSIVRISSKLPCATINVAFITGTPGYIRHRVCEELKLELSSLSYLSTPLKSKESIGCTLLLKPLEKILIRYERMPNDFHTVIFPDGTQNSFQTAPTSPLAGTLFTTLSRYLFHQRWIWSATHMSSPKLEVSAFSRILSTLTKMRIKEGFNFAHSSSGIITMVLELWMDPNSSCVVQYVLFPPYSAWPSDGDQHSDSDEDMEPDSPMDSELQMVTEVWIEPQFGCVLPGNPRIRYMDDKHYYELADMIKLMDMKCINSLLTLEHLSVMCQEKPRFPLLIPATKRPVRRRYNSSCRNTNSSSPVNSDSPQNPWNPTLAQRIQHIPFEFDPINILPLCQQTELLFSMFIEDSHRTSSLVYLDLQKSNRLLLENIHTHLTCLHDQELKLSQEECDRFTVQVISRHKNKYPNLCPLLKDPNKVMLGPPQEEEKSQWRCFVKGVSTTHVILTIIPASLHDLKALVFYDSNNTTMTNSTESTDRASSQASNYSEVPINVTNTLMLPVYIYDCPLALLVDSYVNCPESGRFVTHKDVYEDHRYKFGPSIQEDLIKLKSDQRSSSPEVKSEESEHQMHEPRNNARQHCKAIVLTHSKCFAMSLFSALHYQVFVHCSDVQSAMDQCEETLFEIDITNYLKTICGHLKHEENENISIQQLNQPTACNDLKPLHRLIKDKFFKITNDAFSPIPTNREFYYCRNLELDKKSLKHTDSDDELSNPPSEAEVIELFKSDNLDTFSISNLDGPNILFIQPKEDDLIKHLSPLFLHFVCTIRYNNQVTNTSVRVLPTCLGELIENIETDTNFLEKSKLQVTLDILCLTLPMDVQNVITDYSLKGLRTTSFCSDGFPPSCSSASEASFNSDFKEPEPLYHIPELQKRAINTLKEEVSDSKGAATLATNIASSTDSRSRGSKIKATPETNIIKWLLQDEIATALLDIDPVSRSTLNFVMKHVSDSNLNRPSCLLDIIDLNFVYGSMQSYEKFVQEFCKISIPNYKLFKEGELYYLAKYESDHDRETTGYISTSIHESQYELPIEKFKAGEYAITEFSNSVDLNKSKSSENVLIRNESLSQSDISSLNGSILGTDGGYDEDVSEDDEDYDWLIELNNKRAKLPNFWLITQIEQDAVTIYFHCRFLQLPTTHVGVYIEIQGAILDAIRGLCKCVNQSLLLQSLYDTRTCDHLLEPDDNSLVWNEPSTPVITRNLAFHRLRSMEEINDESDHSASPQLETSVKFEPGYFRCPVVYDIPFVLHPRLKTGPGKSGLSVGISALKTVLDKFSVANRNNMFVYKDSTSNVFYLRLHENANSYLKGMTIKSEFDQPVSRSPSIASLPIGPQRSSTLTRSDFSVSSGTSSEIRPRVRSFGEKETKDVLLEDTVSLKVYGITEAGNDVRLELVQVLQNRLDDAVLELLSVMLSRNAMCPLTPEDVRFLQRPFRAPEHVLQLAIQDHSIKLLDAFVHYLKQNLLQFLNIPKYTDPRPLYHFKDYTDNDHLNKITDDNIFIYNQSQNPSSGNRGIACIALAIIDQDCNPNNSADTDFKDLIEQNSFLDIVASSEIKNSEELPPVYLEFRIWKQGRVNFDTLDEKLGAATNQATWDIITEFYFLRQSLCVPKENAELRIKEYGLQNDLNISAIENNAEEVHVLVPLDTKIDACSQTIVKRRAPEIYELVSMRKKVQRRSTQRALTFDDTDKMYDVVCQTIELSPFELGTEGVLNNILHTSIFNWFEFGIESMVPALCKITVPLLHPNPLYSTVKELQTIIGKFSKDIIRCFKDTQNAEIGINNADLYLVSPDITKLILISRNFEHWKVCVEHDGSPNFPEVISPHALKHLHKFLPATINNKFIPRQKFLWGYIESAKYTLYTYNWSKDNLEKLRESAKNIGLWLNVRASVLISGAAQKRGVFHNQAVDRTTMYASNNPYLSCLGDIEQMIKFPNDRSRRIMKPGMNSAVLESFRDNYVTVNMDHPDPVVALTAETIEIKKSDKKYRDELKKLHSMYQSRTNTSTTAQIKILNQNARVIHYCHTPLLFLASWRVQSAATRDHSIMTPLNSDPVPGAPVHSKPVLLWHEQLFNAFITEYKRYLQTLGFMSLEVDSSFKKHSPPKFTQTDEANIIYMQKAILGGILLFSIQMKEPFFITKLHAIECERIQSTNSRASINQFTQSFLDECDRIKVFMHLHSFTYDFHLRSIFNYIANESGYTVCEGYHLTHFFDDFMKYYNKAPNYARNLVHADSIIIRNLSTEGKQLYMYLLSNVKQYNFNVVSMQDDSPVNDASTEYVLTQVSNISGVSYKDSQDRQHTDDFDITLIISNICTPYEAWEHVLHLKYYLILTSRREIYPKTEVERKLGKFRTVSSTGRNNSTIDLEKEKKKEPDELQISLENSITSERISASDTDRSINLPSTSATTTDDESADETKALRAKTSSYVEIKQESVNYLGYYSSHEQLMQQLILNCADSTQKTIRDMVSQGMVHCRTHLLWNKLLSQQESLQLTYAEFVELKGLAKLENLCDIHPNLGSLLNQSFSWYQGLHKLLIAKYQNQHRAYISDDANIQYYVILHPRYVGAFMMLSMDLHTSRGDLYAVYRTAHKFQDSDMADRKLLLDGFINCICFYLWGGMI